MTKKTTAASLLKSLTSTVKAIALSDGQTVFINTNLATKDKFESMILGEDEKGKTTTDLTSTRSKLIVAAVVDQDGNPLFTLDDVPDLQNMDALRAEPLVKAIRQGLGMDGDEAKKPENS